MTGKKRCFRTSVIIFSIAVLFLLSGCAEDFNRPSGRVTSCNPNWQCTTWKPACSGRYSPTSILETGRQGVSSKIARICRDANNCGTSQGKPLTRAYCITYREEPTSQQPGIDDQQQSPTTELIIDHRQITAGGAWGGGGTGGQARISFHSKGGSVTGSVRGSGKGASYTASLSGTVEDGNKITKRISGRISGTATTVVDIQGEAKTFKGKLTGSWGGTVNLKTGSVKGSWSATAGQRINGNFALTFTPLQIEEGARIQESFGGSSQEPQEDSEGTATQKEKEREVQKIKQTRRVERKTYDEIQKEKEAKQEPEDEKTEDQKETDSDKQKDDWIDRMVEERFAEERAREKERKEKEAQQERYEEEQANMEKHVQELYQDRETIDKIEKATNFFKGKLGDLKDKAESAEEKKAVKKAEGIINNFEAMVKAADQGRELYNVMVSEGNGIDWQDIDYEPIKDEDRGTWDKIVRTFRGKDENADRGENIQKLYNSMAEEKAEDDFYSEPRTEVRLAKYLQRELEKELTGRAKEYAEKIVSKVTSSYTDKASAAVVKPLMAAVHNTRRAPIGELYKVYTVYRKAHGSHAEAIAMMQWDSDNGWPLHEGDYAGSSGDKSEVWKRAVYGTGDRKPLDKEILFESMGKIYDSEN